MSKNQTHLNQHMSISQRRESQKNDKTILRSVIEERMVFVNDGNFRNHEPTQLGVGSSPLFALFACLVHYRIGGRTFELL